MDRMDGRDVGGSGSTEAYNPWTCEVQNQTGPGRANTSSERQAGKDKKDDGTIPGVLAGVVVLGGMALTKDGKAKDGDGEDKAKDGATEKAAEGPHQSEVHRGLLKDAIDNLRPAAHADRERLGAAFGLMLDAQGSGSNPESQRQLLTDAEAALQAQKGNPTVQGTLDLLAKARVTVNVEEPPKITMGTARTGSKDNTPAQSEADKAADKTDKTIETLRSQPRTERAELRYQQAIVRVAEAKVRRGEAAERAEKIKIDPDAKEKDGKKVKVTTYGEEDPIRRTEVDSTGRRTTDYRTNYPVLSFRVVEEADGTRTTSRTVSTNPTGSETIDSIKIERATGELQMEGSQDIHGSHEINSGSTDHLNGSRSSWTDDTEDFSVEESFDPAAPRKPKANRSSPSQSARPTERSANPAKNTPSSKADRRKALDLAKQILNKEAPGLDLGIQNDRILKDVLTDVSNRLSPADGKSLRDVVKNFKGYQVRRYLSADHTQAALAIPTEPGVELQNGDQGLSTRTDEVRRQIANVTQFDDVTALELRNSGRVLETLKAEGMDEKRAEAVQRKLTSKDPHERAGAVLEIDKYFDERIASSTTEATRPSTEREGEKVRVGEGRTGPGWDSFIKKFGDNKGKIGTLIVVVGPLVPLVLNQTVAREDNFAGANFSR